MTPSHSRKYEHDLTKCVSKGPQPQTVSLGLSSNEDIINNTLWEQSSNSTSYTHPRYFGSTPRMLCSCRRRMRPKITEYRFISLIHIISKIIVKMIALQLAPLINNLVFKFQNSSINKRSTHDNFMYVCNLARRLHKRKIPTLLFKLDIHKVFDCVRWEFILELLKRHNLPPQWNRRWPTSMAGA